MESVLASAPGHRGLLAAASAGFTQYAYAWVQQEGDALFKKSNGHLIDVVLGTHRLKQLPALVGRAGDARSRRKLDARESD